MRNTITRTITTTTIKPVTIKFEDGKPVAADLEPITVYGTPTEKECAKIAAKKYGKNNVVVAAVETAEKLYEISLDDFVKYATPVEPKAGAAK